MIRSTDSLFIDTSAFIALYDASDRHHEAAKDFFTAERIRALRVQLVTTNFVFAEVYTYFCRDHGRATIVGRHIRESKILRYLRPGPADEDAAWNLAQEYHDKDFSFVDCLSFVVMSRLGCRKAFAFDSHFRQMGFDMLPD
ncbi:MAG: PIN domain-containing protein [Firmicutes bacterium]|nr:PIN domain-containing protein [Bacillota bacterium]